MGYIALRDARRYPSLKALVDALMDPFNDMCLYLNLMMNVQPYMLIEEIPLAMSQKVFNVQFDKVLNPLLSWLKHLEQTKAPIMSSSVTQMIGHDSQTQLESIWRALIKEKLRPDIPSASIDEITSKWIA